MKVQLNEDMAENKLNAEELEDIDHDVKEAFKPKSEWIEVEASCSAYKSAIDVTCCQHKK